MPRASLPTSTTLAISTMLPSCASLYTPPTLMLSAFTGFLNQCAASMFPSPSSQVYPPDAQPPDCSACHFTAGGVTLWLTIVTELSKTAGQSRVSQALYG